VHAHLDAVVLAARASGQTAAMALLDVDRSKQVNDQRSYAVGDAVLRALAHILQAELRSDDVVARSARV
jgi:diguanylate cyclase (GGDEF)-like protein